MEGHGSWIGVYDDTPTLFMCLLIHLHQGGAAEVAATKYTPLIWLLLCTELSD